MEKVGITIEINLPREGPEPGATVACARHDARTIASLTWSPSESCPRAPWLLIGSPATVARYGAWATALTVLATCAIDAAVEELL